MSLSSTALEQREKEEKALRTFLWLCVISSVVLHGVALAVGVIVPWNRVLAPKQEPVEVTVVEPLPQEAPKLKEEERVVSPQPTTPLKQPESTETPPPEKVQERQPRPTEARRPLEEKAANPTTQTDQPATTAQQPQGSAGGLVNPFEGLLRSGAGGSDQGGGTEAGTGTGIETGSGSGTGVGQGTGLGTGVGQGIGLGTGTGEGTGSGSRSGTGQGTGAGSGSGTAGSGGGGRSGAGIQIKKDESLEGIRQGATAVVRDGKVVDFKFQSTGDAALDRQIREQLDKFKKKVKLPSNARRDGEVQTNITFGEARDKSGKQMKRSRQAQRYLERQAREPRGQTTTRQSGDSTTSSVIQRGVDVPAATRTRSRISPSTPTPVRRTRVQKTQSTYAPSVQNAPSTSTPVRRTRVKVRKIQSPSAPVQSAPSTSTPTNSAPASESE